MNYKLRSTQVCQIYRRIAAGTTKVCKQMLAAIIDDSNRAAVERTQKGLKLSAHVWLLQIDRSLHVSKTKTLWHPVKILVLFL